MRPAVHESWEEPRPRVTFSLTETLHLTLSVVVLSIAFTFALGAMNLIQGVEWPKLAEIFPFAAAIVITSFVLHELAHKIVAQRRMMWAEYRSSYVGLLIGLVLSALTGFVLAAPGAVQIYGRADDRDAGVISLVGPLVNLGLGFLAYPLAVSSTAEPLKVGSVGNLFELVVFINGFLAVFNMVPVPPLDGSKVWRWSKTAYFAVIALAGLLLWLWFSGATSLG